MNRTTTSSREAPRGSRSLRLGLALLAILPLGTGCETIAVKAGQGDFDFGVETSGLESQAGVQVLNVQLEREPTGGKTTSGLELEFWVTDDDLLGDTGVGDSELKSVEFSPYAKWLHDDGGLFRWPVRLGLTFQQLDVDFITAMSESSYETLGIKAGVSPELDLVRGPKGAITLYGDAYYMLGWSTVETAGLASASRDAGTTLTGFDGGLRYERGNFTVSAGYLFRRFESDEVDDEFGAGTIFGVDHEVSAVVGALSLKL